MTEITPLTLAFVALAGFLLGVVLSTLLAVSYVLYSFWNQVVWTDDATMRGKVHTSLKYLYYEGQWDNLAREVPKVGLGFAVGAALLVLCGVGVYEVFVT